MSGEKLRVLICDDEPLFVERIREITEATLADYDCSVTAAGAPEEVLAAPQAYDIAVLDIQFTQLNGIDLAAELGKLNENLQIIFVSGYVRYVSDVYDVPHLGLVLKDELDVRLPDFLQRALAALEEGAGQVLVVKNRAGTHQIPTRDILYLERIGHSTRILLRDGSEIPTFPTIDSLLADCRDSLLLRCHKSYAVNLRHTRKWNAMSFELTSGHSIPISRSRQESAKEQFFGRLTSVK